MRSRSRRAALALAALAAVGLVLGRTLDGDDPWHDAGSVALPDPSTDGDESVAAALAARRSRREYGPGPLSIDDLGQLLWAAQGVTDPASGGRTAPSAGARYPLETYVVVGSNGVGSLDAGVYRYRPERHDLLAGAAGDRRPRLRRAALDQPPVGAAPVSVVCCGVDERTTTRYGDRGRLRYVPMEAGHAAENVYIAAEARGLATVAVGAFDDDEVRAVLDAPADRRPLYVLPVGPRT